MKILVQKFGGTSVATPESRLAAVRHIERAREEGYAVVVVVSAMGRKGDPYATDTLLSLFQVDDAQRPLAARDRDLLMACGETISAVVFANMLRNRGHKVQVMTGAQAGILTNDDFGNARILDIRPDRILTALGDDQIVVVMGFQGANEAGEITTLGRGGSDTTATALGVALEADAVDIFTDVSGIMTADPRLVDDARQLSQVTYTEICNLAYQGAKVIHPRAVEIAMQRNIPIRVRSTHSDDPGTLVTQAPPQLEHGALFDRFVTGIAHSANLTQIRLSGHGIGTSSIFTLMAEHDISVDFISVTPFEVAFTVGDDVAEIATQKLQELGYTPEVRRGCAKVSVVGAGIMGVPGIMAKIVEALAVEGIDILQSADSHTTIWVLVDGEHMGPAVRALHRAFQLAGNVA
ncbi:aspartate kinase [Alicyclobacillus acidoterrestris]|uniref:Aspartokinase n=1 Tax=Alicyclobacillus acidoterrestris (strain ATCC 49025 / DSM 3922 / CIP 106132 / NCIMB 13137 / GD3B) TaxID=1356854 RepID=T0D3R1_ALIAG|nr:aspartate kinase [Alicyclobacillus acidoterrestris]EPZ46212.1 aspartate kinase [Alicyclobacillus acidoterrestris ATCC 49025]UNO47155.1 aspartate kinase [Alicyclobacillus acidoterrestris]